MNLLIIKADTNDGDYVTSQTWASDEQIELAKKVAEVIKTTEMPEMKWGKQRHNWCNGDLLREDLGEKGPRELYASSLTEDELDEFEDMMPYGEYGVHTLVSIEVHKVVETQKIF